MILHSLLRSRTETELLLLGWVLSRVNHSNLLLAYLNHNSEAQGGKQGGTASNFVMVEVTLQMSREKLVGNISVFAATPKMIGTQQESNITTEDPENC